MECRSANDIYLLLKSSDFVTHDLEHAFDDCVDSDEQGEIRVEDIPYVLVLRKYVQLNPSLEFRCFVRRRKLIAICQRDLNHFEFLFKMQDDLGSRIQEFFEIRLQDTFPDENFAFDVYIPPPHDRVWLVDVNPWAMRTDPLLFSWMELLTMPAPRSSDEAEVVRLPLKPASATAQDRVQELSDTLERERLDDDSDDETVTADDDTDVEEMFFPEFRLVRKDDPEAYGFTTPQYSAHKLPKDVVDASQGGEGQLREFANQWKDVLAKAQKEDQEAEEGEAD